VEPVDVPSFYRPNYFEHVGDECRSAREGIGIADASHAARFAVTGPGAEAMLDRLLCTRLPEPGGVATGYVLSRLGTVRSEFTVVREAEDRFLLTSAAGAERYDLDLLLKARPGDGAVATSRAVKVENLTGREGALAVFGPQAAELIAQVTEIPASEVAEIDVAPATVGYAPARIVRSGVGGLDGWQIQVQSEFLRHAFMALMEALSILGRRSHPSSPPDPARHLIGARALNCLRLEAGAPAWGADLTRAFTALESGLGPLVDFDKGEFRGRDALLRQKEAGVARRLVRLEVSGNDSFNAMGQEPVRKRGATRSPSGEVVGTTTSGGFGHCLGKSLAMAYLSSAAFEGGGELEVKLMNQWFPARILPGAE
jgi:dimethylglycine dehydrogenase